MLDLAGRSRPARQLVDVIRYYHWDTAHWRSPISMAPPVRDFETLKQDNRGAGGYTFQKRVDSGVQAVVSTFTHVHYWPESSLATAREAMEGRLNLLGEPLPMDPWDGIIWLPEERRAIVLEVKLSHHKLGRLKKQVVKREANLELWRALGISVQVVGVIGGRRPLHPNHSIKLFAASHNVEITNLQSLENGGLEALLKAR